MCDNFKPNFFSICVIPEFDETQAWDVYAVLYDAKAEINGVPISSENNLIDSHLLAWGDVEGETKGLAHIQIDIKKINEYPAYNCKVDIRKPKAGPYYVMVTRHLASGNYTYHCKNQFSSR